MVSILLTIAHNFYGGGRTSAIHHPMQLEHLKQRGHWLQPVTVHLQADTPKNNSTMHISALFFYTLKLLI
jgi:hypothetical protein